MTADTRPNHSGSRRLCRRTLLLFLSVLLTLSALLSVGLLPAAAEDAPAAIRPEGDDLFPARRPHLERIVRLGAEHLREPEAVAELDALHRRDAEKRRGKL